MGLALKEREQLDMANLRLVLVVLFFVCELLAAISVPSGRVNLMAAGLACWAASMLFG